MLVASPPEPLYPLFMFDVSLESVATSPLGFQVAISDIKSRVFILSAAALLLIQGIYGIVECWFESDWASALFCIAAINAGLGLAFRAWWSRPIVLALVLLLLIPSCHRSA